MTTQSQVDLYSIIGQLYVNLLSMHNKVKQLEEAEKPLTPAPKPEQEKAEAISK